MSKRAISRSSFPPARRMQSSSAPTVTSSLHTTAMSRLTENARLYEIGRIYLPGGPDGLANEPKMLTLGAYGDGYGFFTMKGAVVVRMMEVSSPRGLRILKEARRGSSGAQPILS